MHLVRIQANSSPNTILGMTKCRLVGTKFCFTVLPVDQLAEKAWQRRNKFTLGQRTT